MPLNTAQLTTLRNAINAETATVTNAGQTLSVKDTPNTPDWNTAITDFYNAAAAGPNNIGWKSKVPIGEVGAAFDGPEFAGLSTANTTRLQTLAMYFTAGVNPSVAGTRAFFNDIFSGAGGTNTRPALLALWKRTMTRAEKLFATGTGSSASPATFTFEGKITNIDVESARNS